jgi:ABC-type multidrug transport system fused ATPase/permease subunit
MIQNKLPEAATKAITVLVRDGLTVIGLLGLMFYQSFILSVGLFVIGPVIAIFIKLMSVKFRDTSKHIQKSMGYITNVVEELIAGHRVVKIFGGENSEKKSFSYVNKNNRDRHLKLALIQGISIPSCSIYSCFIFINDNLFCYLRWLFRSYLCRYIYVFYNCYDINICTYKKARRNQCSFTKRYSSK